VLWPRRDGELTAFVRWLAHTHAMRWHVAHRTVGCGHLYQGRFKSFPIQEDEHFLTVCRYVERNALTAKAVKRAEAWRWSSLWVREHGDERLNGLLSDWPVDRPRGWVRVVNEPFSARQQEAIRTCVTRNRPFGGESWQRRTIARLGLMHTLRPEGRPKKERKQ
jgi:putative transposase